MQRLRHGTSPAHLASRSCPPTPPRPRAGGNSMKASSGINALAPEQSDSPEAFRDDTLRSGGGLSVPELVDTLVVRRPASLACCWAVWCA